MRYNHILFDLDGTLTDPGVGITKSVQYALHKFGIEEECDALKWFIGPPLQVSFRERYGFAEEQVEQAIRYYREYFSEHGIFENELYPAMKETLETLIHAGCKLHVATSKPTVFAERILIHFDIMECFHSVTGSFLDGARSDKSEIIAHVLREQGISTADAIMIGDRKHDLIGATNNQIASIGVTYGYGSVEELSACNPTVIVDTVQALEAWLLEASSGEVVGKGISNRA
ncbi:phosphoglycolate phosphatase [Paenibacillus cellulosilyticus]|uniref:Phosphoglycolate phosphatase n=1 Tax=Paenibacillus cellulosilyticus TaxID=375489 RepID=A0A2V2YED9_9BACL|nr:HAD family hydrolase [Paenibacillus cellulosilyticus]PWV90961.1 phosphoglycolate phosphatase [Paenibacillus cellulosilyticus]QKS45179.1 HAD family hydrolase [Paenibacillus cellulosilyticus]